MDLKTTAAISFMMVVLLWNITKLPFYMAFNNDGNDEYNKRGIELSINLGHWVPGYRTVKMRTPACNFILVHATIGITLLFMMILTLIRKKWRKKYCVPFFCFSIVHGIHSFPAAIINDSLFLRILFIVACVGLIGSGLWGLKTNRDYEQDRVKGDLHLLICYIIIAVINSVAAVLEGNNIFVAYRGKDNGVFELTEYGDEPHKRFGNTLYDALPEKVGMAVFLGFVFAVWFVWPMYLLQVGKDDSEEVVAKKNTNETTPLTSKKN